MHIKFVLVKSMLFLQFLKPQLDKVIGTESKNFQINQALTKCEG